MHVCDTRYPVARRDRTCDLCARTIRAGTRYARTPVMYDGSWRQWYEHEQCRAEVLRLLDRDREDTYPEYALVNYYCSEDWSPEYAAFRRTLLCPACRDEVGLRCSTCAGRRVMVAGDKWARCPHCSATGKPCEECGGWDGR